MKTIVAIVCISIFTGACSPYKLRNRSVVKVQLKLDSSQVFRQSGYLSPGLEIRLNNGKKKGTFGMPKGTWGWRRFNVKTENAKFVDGNLFYNPETVIKQNKKVKIIVQPKNNLNYSDSFEIEFPRPEIVSLYHEDATTLAPGHPIKTQLSVVYNNGKIIHSTDKNGAFLWDLFTLKHNGTSSHNTITPIINVPFFVEKHPVKAVYKYNDSVYSMLAIPLNYKATYKQNFDGSNGNNGWDGGSGNNSRCSDGAEGNSGQDGEHGEHGGRIKVFCLLVKAETGNFLHVMIEKDNKKEYSIINTDGGKLEISCRGGNGGDGGNGGWGGDGAAETENRTAGRGGNGGNGGNGGDGGNGGNVYFYVDEESAAYTHLISVNNEGGKGGQEGRGGRGGSGGTKKEYTFFDILLGANRGFRGNRGHEGQNGAPGNTPQKINTSRKYIQMSMGLEVE